MKDTHLEHFDLTCTHIEPLHSRTGLCVRLNLGTKMESKSTGVTTEISETVYKDNKYYQQLRFAVPSKQK